MIVNIKPLVLVEIGTIKTIAAYVDIQPIAVPLDGSDTSADCILGTAEHVLAARLNVPITKDEMANWGPDDNMINLILTKLGAVKADAQ